MAGMSEILHFRITLESADTLPARAKAILCTNATKWRTHPPRTVRIKGVSWERTESGYFVVSTDIERDDGSFWVIVNGEPRCFGMPGAVDFNDFDFGEMLAPSHMVN